MLNPTQVLAALNLALQECSLGEVSSLDDDRTTNGNNSCVQFGGALLEHIPHNFDTVATNALDPTDQTTDGFYQFSVQGDPSDLNHVFCVYFSSNEVRIIQVFLGHSTKLIRKIARETLLRGLQLLRSGEPVQAYRELFGVEIDVYTVSNIWTTRVKES